MITLVEALNYRCLRYTSRPLSSFHVLVGPNASGKTTFLDVIGFLSDLVFHGLDQALADRAQNHDELLFRGQGDRFELAVGGAHSLRSAPVDDEAGMGHREIPSGNWIRPNGTPV